MSYEYKVVYIPKSNGKHRVVYVAGEEQKSLLRRHLPYLEERVAELDRDNVIYAFVRGKNCALNALRHVGFNYTLSLDIENFFASITSRHVSGLIHDEVAKDCFVDGAPQQGLPTSPLIANIAFVNCDRLIIAALKSESIDAVYTRYADDMIFSFNNKRDAVRIRHIVSGIVCDKNFKLNQEKIKLQNSMNGRRIITGVAVDASGIYATRKVKKKLRAALHQKNIASARGLLQWSKCKLPRVMVSKHG